MKKILHGSIGRLESDYPGCYPGCYRPVFENGGVRVFVRKAADPARVGPNPGPEHAKAVRFETEIGDVYGRGDAVARILDRGDGPVLEAPVVFKALEASLAQIPNLFWTVRETVLNAYRLGKEEGDRERLDKIRSALGLED